MMTPIARSNAPSSTGSNQSRSKTPSRGSHVDHTDSPTRMTLKLGLGHEVEILLEPFVRLVLAVVGGSEEHTTHGGRHATNSPATQAMVPTVLEPATRSPHKRLLHAM